MEENSGYVLAMYDVRGKQNFIYKSQKIKEIIGGSKIIEDVFKDYLYPAAKKYCGMDEKDICNESVQVIYDYHNESADAEDKNKFSSENFKRRMDEGNYIGEVVYEGGGNFFVLYRDAETCVEVNKIFTAKLLREIGTLKVLCTYIPVNNFSDYKRDRDALYGLHRVHEAQESVIYPVNTLPFIQTSPNDNRPYIYIENGKQVIKEQKITLEQKAKYEKYKECNAKEKADPYNQEEYLLDKLVEQRGEESLLAVIYIDGNGMGAKVEACLKGDENDSSDSTAAYDQCITALRNFSADIQSDYVVNRIKAINNTLEQKHEEKTKGKVENQKKVRRTIVAAGDEMTVICNARDALDVVRAYFGEMPEDGSSCAGIAIFHSHAPYADVYRIAEECCESCKKYMKENKIEGKNFMDFHYCQGAIGISLDSIRKRETGGQLFSRPWQIEKNKEGSDKIIFSPTFNRAENGTEKKPKYYGIVNSFAEKLNKTARGNVKALRDAAQSGKGALKMELKRINAHSAKEKQMEFSLMLEEQRNVIYDITMVYDLWFAKEEQDDNETSDTED